jgi:hypothetical protein
MPKKKRTLIVIGKLKAFDEDAWKRLLMAYAYYLHEQRTEIAPLNADDSDQGSARDEHETGGRS